MTAAQIRKAYLDFFAARGHSLCPSSPLVPQGDASLMFTSAGMVPFKPYFLGLKKDLSRAASCQKCFRTTDIDRVGQTIRHLTFFEMLGNFSFGDYFKQESIAWAWEFLTKDMGFDPKRLHSTVFKDDEEALGFWTKLGVPNKPVRLGEDTNFWNMGPTGPCGPCSEIYFDRGPGTGCGKPGCAVGCDCDRYLEIWNLVFTQFDRREDGTLKPLPRKNIDTGMGLERLVFASQGKASPFDTDLFSPVVEAAAKILGVEPRASAEAELAYRVIGDHARAATMLMAEGIIPSNVERGYVLRRLVRRAARYGQLLGHGQPFLHRLVPAAIGIFKAGYPELEAAASQVASTMKIEEERFLETLSVGEHELRNLLEKTKNVLPGDEAFRLYETFGFPLELTQEICAKRGIPVDEHGFKEAADKASQLAKTSWKGSKITTLGSTLFRGETEFTGWDSLEELSMVDANENNPVDVLTRILILNKTPFFPEGGGQVGDTGEIYDIKGGKLAEVTDTQKQDKLILHIIKVMPGCSLSRGDQVVAKVNVTLRNEIAPHHTGTHLLNAALRRILGNHVRQAGSYVGADKLRFDFTHPGALGPELLSKVEAMVVEEIKKDDPVIAEEHPAEKVKEYGAVSLLGEDYGSRPRFVLIGTKDWNDHNNRFSLELCGGTHVKKTSDIAAFKILKESSVAAGVRRIEALAGKAVEDYERLKSQEAESSLADWRRRERELLEEVARLGGEAKELGKDADAAALRVREKELKELAGRLKARKLSEQARSGGDILEVKGLRLCVRRLEGADPKNLRSICDQVKAELGSGLVFLAAPQNGKLSFVLAATPDLPAKGVDAARIAKAFAAARGGSAGGRADFAQGGAKDGDWDALTRELSALLG